MRRNSVTHLRWQYIPTFKSAVVRYIQNTSTSHHYYICQHFQHVISIN